MLENLVFVPAVAIGGFALLCASLLAGTHYVITHTKAAVRTDEALLERPHAVRH